MPCVHQPANVCRWIKKCWSATSHTEKKVIGSEINLFVPYVSYYGIISQRQDNSTLNEKLFCFLKKKEIELNLIKIASSQA